MKFSKLPFKKLYLNFISWWVSFVDSCSRVFEVAKGHIFGASKINFREEFLFLKDSLLKSNICLLVANQVFDESVTHADNKLDRGEFFCAMLLLFHKLDSLPITGKKTTPKRRDLNAIFYYYILLQSEAESILIDEGNTGCPARFEEVLQQLSTSRKRRKKKVKLAPYIAKECQHHYEVQTKRYEMIRVYFENVMSQVKKPEPYLAAIIFYLCFEVFNILCQIVTGQNIDSNIMGYMNRAVAMLLSTSAIIVFYHPPQKRREEPHEEVDDIVRNEVRRDRKKNHSSKRLPTKSKRDSIAKEQFVAEKVGDALLRKETFLFICRRHFNSLVISESWRLLWKLVLIPCLAWELKRILEKRIEVSGFIIGYSLLPGIFPSYQEIPFVFVVAITTGLVNLFVGPITRIILYYKLHKKLKEDLCKERQNRKKPIKSEPLEEEQIGRCKALDTNDSRSDGKTFTNRIQNVNSIEL